MPLPAKGDAMRYRACYRQKPYPGFYGGADCAIEFDATDNDAAWDDFQQHISMIESWGAACTVRKLFRSNGAGQFTQVRRDLIIVSVQAQDLLEESLVLATLVVPDEG